jgi:2-polyprenyl-6-methoxyphenol hydroxylase-like FAD-dependent oxidoreductase
MARILIVGGSLAGLFAGNMLLRDGHDVLIVERSASALDGRGAGIVTHQALNHALGEAGVTELDTLGVEIRRRIVLGSDGRIAHLLPSRQVLTSWSRLHSLLMSRFPEARYRLNRSFVGAVEHESGVAVTMRCGGTEVVEQADLLIGCDGIRSSVRALLWPAVRAQYAGYIAWRGMCEEAELSTATRERLFDAFGFALADGEQMLGYPVAGQGDTTAPGLRRYNTVWYRNVASGAALAELLTDEHGVHFPGGIAPGAIARRHVHAMRDAAQGLFAPAFAEAVAMTLQPFLQPIYDLACEEMAAGRIAIAGDAAFVARPHVGMGVTKAAQDASALAASLRTHGATPMGLAAYAGLRLTAGRAVVERGRELGQYMTTKAHRARSGMSAADQASWVLRNVAVDPDAPAFPLRGATASLTH